MFHIRSSGTRLIEQSSGLAADPEVVWQRVASVDGINAELWPLRMHLPRQLDVLAELAGTRQRRGVLISLLGWIPLDWHRLGIKSIEPGRGFHEESTSLWMRSWTHVRSLERTGSGCTLRDRVQFAPRIALLGWLVAPLYRRVFRRRHAELRRHFGTLESGAF